MIVFKSHWVIVLTDGNESSSYCSGGYGVDKEWSLSVQTLKQMGVRGRRVRWRNAEYHAGSTGVTQTAEQHFVLVSLLILFRIRL